MQLLSISGACVGTESQQMGPCCKENPHELRKPSNHQLLGLFCSIHTSSIVHTKGAITRAVSREQFRYIMSPLAYPHSDIDG